MAKRTLAAISLALSLPLSLNNIQCYAQEPERPAIFLRGNGFLLASTPAPNDKPTTANIPSLGHIPLSLKLEDQIGYIAFPEPEGSIPEVGSTLLLSINGTDIIGRSKDEIRNLLTAPANSIAKIELLKPDGEIRTLELKVEPNAITQSNSSQYNAPKALAIYLAQLDGLRSNEWPLNFATQFAPPVTDNLDLLNLANSRLTLNFINTYSFGSKPAINQLAVPAMLNAQMAGNLSATEEFTKLMLETSDLKSVTPQQIEHSYEDAITQCLTAGRTAQTLALCEKLIKSLKNVKPNNYDHPEGEAAQLTTVFLKDSVKAALLKHDYVQAGEFLDQLFSMLHKCDYGEDDTWLGDHYLAIGKFPQALSCYQVAEKKKEEQDPKIISEFEKTIYSQRRDASLYYNIGLCHSGNKNFQEAQKYFQKALSCYKLLESKSNHSFNLNTLDRLAFLSPSPSEINIARAHAFLDSNNYQQAAQALQQVKQKLSFLRQTQTKRFKQTLLLLSRVKEKLNEKLEADRLQKQAASIKEDTDALPRTTAEQFEKISSIYQAIDSGNLAAATAGIESLLEVTGDEFPAHCFRERNINTTTALLAIARYLSDHHYLQESNNLLDSLEEVASRSNYERPERLFIQCEKNINAQREQLPGKAPWPNIQAIMQPLGFTPGEGFRKLAILYACAGEYDRANILLGHAATLPDIASPQNLAAQQNQALYYLDKANLNLHFKNYTDAQTNFSRAKLLILGLGQNSDKKAAINFNTMYRNKVCDLAQGFMAVGKGEDAENILKDTLKQIENRTPCLLAGITPIAGYETYTNVNSILEENLALILFHENKLKEALPYIEKSIKVRNEYYPPVFSIMRAKCLEAEGSFSAAANSYLLAAESGYSPPDLNESNYCNAYHEQLLRDALRCSQQAQDLSPEKKAQFLLPLARFLERTSLDTKAVLEIYRQAYNLLPDKAEEKISTASQIATLWLRLNWENQQLSHQPNADDSISQEALKMQEEAAKLAQEQDPILAGGRWMELAELQAQANLLDSALQNTKKALNLFRSTPSQDLSAGLLPAPYNCVILELCAQNQSAEAESLLLASEEILKTAPGGIKSPQYIHFLTLLVQHYIEQKNHEKANARLKQLLSVNPRKIYLAQREVNWGIDELVKALSEQPTTSKEESANLKYLQTILDGELQYFAADDIRIAIILKAIAESEFQAKHYNQAAKYYARVLSINKLYGYGHEYPLPLWQKYKEILQAGGEKQKAESLQEKIQKEQKLKDKIDNFSVFKKNNLELKEFYSWLQSVAPYSTCAEQCCDALLEQAQTARNWQEVSKLARVGLINTLHQGDEGSCGCGDLWQPIARRTKYYRSLLEAYLAMNQKEQVNQVLQEIQAGRSYNPSIEELVFLASIYDIGGDKENAINYCKQAREQLKATPSQDQFRDDINRLLQKLTTDNKTSPER